MNCFRYLDFKSFQEVDQLTLPEYELLMEAHRLKEVDRDYRNHLQAYLNFLVQKKKKAGKDKEVPFYNTFRKFYDYEKELNKAKEGVKKKSKFSNLSNYIKNKQKGG